MGTDAIKRLLAAVLCVACFASVSEARIQGYRGGGRVNVQNRSGSANLNRNANANVNRNADVNRNANINRNADVNVNRNADVNVNRDVNVDRDVNVSGYHGGYRGGYVVYDDDPGWNWGAFAAGAAVGVAGTAIGAAATHDEPSTTTVVTTAPPPAAGTIVGTLPGGCTSVASGGGTLYNCNNVYYKPYYQGTALVYQVVPG